MNVKSKNLIIIITVLLGFTISLLAIYYLALTYSIGNLQLFAFIVLVIPSVFIMGVAFIFGFFMPGWSWKKGVFNSILLALLTYAIGTFSISTFNMASDSISKQDEHMDMLYDELDKKAYAAMIEQGIISEGEEISSGPVGGDSPDAASKDTSNGKIAYSEVYVGLGESDTISEILSIILHILLALGTGFAGAKVKLLSDKRKEQHV